MVTIMIVIVQWELNEKVRTWQQTARPSPVFHLFTGKFWRQSSLIDFVIDIIRTTSRQKPKLVSDDTKSWISSRIYRIIKTGIKNRDTY
jgi:hypothetical protein